MAGDYMQGDHDNAVQVPFSDDEAEPKNDNGAADLLDDDKPAASPEEALTRKRNRQERLQRLINEGRQSKEELGKTREELGSLKSELERLKGFVAANENNRRLQERPAGKDPFEARLDAVYERQERAYNAAQAEIKAGTFNDERSKYYSREAREIEAEKSAIHTERALAAREPHQRAIQARQAWEQKYPDVYNNPAAYQYAEATHRRRRALGEADTAQLVDEVMNEAMVTFKLGPKKPPSASERSRLSGLPSSGGGGGERGSGITMTPALRKMAAAAYSDLPEPEAIKRWTDREGKRLREKKVL